MKFTLLLILPFCAFVSLGSAQETLHPWTDLQGRTLQASFIKSDGVTVTIKWNGKVVPIPLSSLSVESKALAQKLSTTKASASSNPFDTVAPPTQPEQLHSWTDLQGRTLKAAFIKADSTSVTVKWQGKIVPLPLANLNSASRALVADLSGSSAPPPVKVSPSTEIVTKPVVPDDLKSEISLDAEHSWKSTTGSVIKAKFISIEGESLNLLMHGGRSEQTIPLTRFSKDSQELANKLQSLLVKQNKARQQLANQRKKMKVPELVEGDLGRSHSWISSDGNKIDAIFVAANDKGVTLLMRNNPNRPYELPWERLNPESQALGEGLKRLKEKLMPKNPAILPAKGGSLPRYGDGKWKGYNTVLESAVYDVALHGNANIVHIWLKNEGKEGEAALGERAKRVPLSINFRPYYYLNPGERNRQWKRRKIVSYDDPPSVSMDREETTIRGTLDNGSTFEYVMQINPRGLSFWGEVEEKSPGEYPTIFSIALYSPNFIPDVANKTMAEIEPMVGDGCLYIDPLESKRAKIPMLDTWKDVLGKLSGASWNPIKSAELMGFPFGSHKIKVTPTSLSDMIFRWGKGYSGTFPFQGIHLVHRTQDSYDAAQSKTPGEYKKRLEIPRNKRLNVNIIRGRG